MHVESLHFLALGGDLCYYYLHIPEERQVATICHDQPTSTVAVHVIGFLAALKLQQTA